MKYLLAVLLLMPTISFSDDLLTEKCNEIEADIENREKGIADWQKYVDDLKSKSKECHHQKEEVASIKEALKELDIESNVVGVNWSDIEDIRK